MIATPNLNGDYLSDALAAQVGGIGIAPGGNINYETGHAIFEATHGTAPKYADLDKVNPGSVILSGCMMFRYLGWREVADAHRGRAGEDDRPEARDLRLRAADGRGARPQDVGVRRRDHREPLIRMGRRLPWCPRGGRRRPPPAAGLRPDRRTSRRSYAHPYHYYRGALLDRRAPAALALRLHERRWRAVGRRVDAGPLYFLFMAARSGWAGPPAARARAQCVLEAGTAVLVARAGACAAGRARPLGRRRLRGLLAGGRAAQPPADRKRADVLLVGAIAAVIGLGLRETPRRARPVEDRRAGCSRGAGRRACSRRLRPRPRGRLRLPAAGAFLLALVRSRGALARARWAAAAGVVRSAGLVPIAPWWARNWW